jgi:hypothetical protein
LREIRHAQIEKNEKFTPWLKQDRDCGQNEQFSPLLKQIEVVEAVDVNGHLVHRLHDVRRPDAEPDPLGLSSPRVRLRCGGVQPPRRRRYSLGRCARAVLDAAADEAPHAAELPGRPRRADPRITAWIPAGGKACLGSALTPSLARCPALGFGSSRALAPAGRSLSGGEARGGGGGGGGGGPPTRGGARAGAAREWTALHLRDCVVRRGDGAWGLSHGGGGGCPGVGLRRDGPHS